MRANGFSVWTKFLLGEWVCWFSREVGTQRAAKNAVKKDLHGAIMALGHYFIFLSAINENNIFREIVYRFYRRIIGLYYLSVGRGTSISASSRVVVFVLLYEKPADHK